jgi:hypothetical protein
VDTAVVLVQAGGADDSAHSRRGYADFMNL